MAQYNSVNAKLSDSQVDQLKSVTKNKTGMSVKLSSNMIIKLIFCSFCNLKSYC